MQDTLAQRQAEIIEGWFNSDWCEWRVHIRDCKNAEIWQAIYAIHSVWCFILAAMGLWACNGKVVPLWRKGHRILEFSGGALRPRAVEGFLVVATVGIFGRAMYSTVICLSPTGFGSEAATEFFQVFSFVLFYDAVVVFTVGIVFAIPRQRLVGNITVRVRLPSPQVLNWILILLVGLPTIIIPTAATLDGHSRDTLRPDRAWAFFRLFCFSWTVSLVLIGIVLVYFGGQLMMALLETERVMTSMTNSHRDTVKNANEAKFRRSIVTTIVTLTALFMLDVAYCVTLCTFGLYRIEIQSFLPYSIIVGSCWILILPTLLTPVFAIMCYGLRKNEIEDKSYRTSETGCRTRGSETAGTGTANISRQTRKSEFLHDGSSDEEKGGGVDATPPMPRRGSERGTRDEA
ncbi:uncharacterized protein EV422DRAFT_45329 [Fimicolochytrium jonesii]|uniref:uncharacterized protein n=1 Tax=Fimicolochytrium jonesii TaxID=1396493 RepID=UPI0022FEA77A|nr:uncharacterized protein EV422DRAFT_45329 [Fimicolochytrium jonesii]KAI8821508.1 hypothetical protein EV422DRAFT_45329 [Fimicolochytrium jonesii]